MMKSAFLIRLRNNLARALWGGLLCFGIRKGDLYRLLGWGKLTAHQRELLRVMRCDNAASASPFRASEFWLELNESFDSWLEVEGIFDVESHTINQYFSGHPPLHILHHATWLFYHNIKARDRWNILGRIPATANRESGYGYLFEGDYVSWDFLISLDTLLAIAEIDDSILTQPVTVLDLGAGWGRIGYVLKSVNPSSVYIACDLPEGLLMSSTYLPRLLPNAKVFNYLDNKDVKLFTKELLLREGGIRFCGSQDMMRFADKSVDFLINVASFQEMTLAQVNQYFDIIDRKVGRMLYIQEYWDGLKMGHTKREISGCQSYPFRQHWKRHYVRNTSFSDVYFEAAYTIGSLPSKTFA